MIQFRETFETDRSSTLILLFTQNDNDGEGMKGNDVNEDVQARLNQMGIEGETDMAKIMEKLNAGEAPTGSRDMLRQI